MIYLSISSSISDGDGWLKEVERVPYGNQAVARIDELSGRSIGRYIIGKACLQAKRRNGRESAYVATNRDSPWRETHGTRGFHVEVIRTPAILTCRHCSGYDGCFYGCTDRD